MSEAITWMLERNVFDDGNPQRIASILSERGVRHIQPQFVSVQEDDLALRPTKPILLSDDEPIFVYGSMNLCRWLLRENKWSKLAWYDFDRLRCKRYYAEWGDFILQRDHQFLRLAEVAERRAELFKKFGECGRVFIRPDDNAKSFAGGIVEESSFDTWWKRANFYNPGPETLAVVARPQQIETEWRLIIATNRVVAGSLYRKNGHEVLSSEYPTEAAHFAEQVASAGFEPHPVYVMDVCKTPDAYRVVEIGSVCCASLYSCDLEKVVTAVQEAAVQW